MTGQSRRGSLLEALLNIAVGFGINMAATAFLAPYFGFTLSLHQNMAWGLIFTGISLARSYWLRRLFNWLHLRGRRVTAG